MRNLYSDLSPPTPKLHSVFNEDYRNSIVDRFSMVFFVFLVIFNKYQNRFLINIFLRNFLNVQVSCIFNLYNGCQEGRCPS